VRSSWISEFLVGRLGVDGFTSCGYIFFSLYCLADESNFGFGLSVRLFFVLWVHFHAIMAADVGACCCSFFFFWLLLTGISFCVWHFNRGVLKLGIGYGESINRCLAVSFGQ